MVAETRGNLADTVDVQQRVADIFRHQIGAIHRAPAEATQPRRGRNAAATRAQSRDRGSTRPASRSSTCASRSRMAAPTYPAGNSQGTSSRMAYVPPACDRVRRFSFAGRQSGEARAEHAVGPIAGLRRRRFGLYINNQIIVNISIDQISQCSSKWVFCRPLLPP